MLSCSVATFGHRWRGVYEGIAFCCFSSVIWCFFCFTILIVEWYFVVGVDELEINDCHVRFSLSVFFPSFVPRRALGVPTTENSFEDGQAMMNAAENLNLPIAEDLVHINRIVRQFGSVISEFKCIFCL